MTSALELTCRAIAEDLTANVAGLAGATVHLLTPEDPEKLQVPKDNRRHLAVWPVGETAGPAQTATGFANDADEVTDHYSVVVWEEAATQASRAKRDEARASEFLQLYEDARARFYVYENRHQGDSNWLKFTEMTMGEAPGPVRYFHMTLEASRFISYPIYAE